MSAMGSRAEGSFGSVAAPSLKDSSAANPSEAQT